MSSLSPFQIGQQVSKNFAPMIEQQKDTGAIEDIFAQVQEREDSGQGGGFDDLMGQIMQRVSPKNQKAATAILEGKKKDFVENRSQKSYKEFAQKLREANPNSPLYNSLATVYESDIPTDQKNQLAKNINESLPFKIKQQHRLDQQQISNTYKTWIKEKEEEIKAARYFDAPKLRDELKELKKERDLAINLDPFSPEIEEVETEIDISKIETVVVEGADQVTLNEDEVLMQDTNGTLRKVKKDEVSKAAIKGKYKLVKR